MDGQFHQLLYSMSKSRMLKHILRDLHNYVGRTRGASLKSEGRAQSSLEEHQAVLDAIRSRDGELAKECMTRHVNNTAKNVLKHHLQSPARRVMENPSQVKLFWYKDFEI